MKEIEREKDSGKQKYKMRLMLDANLRKEFLGSCLLTTVKNHQMYKVL